MSTSSNTNEPTSASPHPVVRQYKDLLPKRKSAYKQLFVMGRFFPWTIYGAYMNKEEPMTMEEIAFDRDIPVEAVKEAIEYYESQPPEMLEDFRREDRLMEARGMNDPNYKLKPTPRTLTLQELAEIRRG